MKTKETPYEYYNNKLGTKIKFLISDKKPHSKSLRLIKYRTLSHRMNSETCIEKQLRDGSWSYDALVEFNSLCQEWRDLLTVTFGKPKEKVQQSYFAKHYIADRKAFDFYCAYRFGENNERKLEPEVIELYTYNASVLNTVISVKNNRKAYAKALGGVKLNIWESLSRDVNAFRDVNHNLPTTPTSLRHKVTKYTKGSYNSIISRKYGLRNAAKVKHNEQKILIEELLKKHQNLNNEQIASLYNITAKMMRWDIVTAGTVANYRRELDLYTYAGRRGETNFRNTKSMQNKRKRPSVPMVYWTLDGWDVELLYKKETTNKKGHKVTTYHNRLNAVLILDPFNNYPIGYAIGTDETPALIKEAIRNAMNHTKHLFGSRFKPFQLQADNYQIKHLTPLYSAMTKHFTPARVRNSKTKVIEPFFNEFNKKHFQAKLVPNWSGHNVNAKKENQPNTDYLNKIRKQFPDELGCRMQIIQAIENERKEKVQAYVENWQNLPENDRSELPTNEYLRWFGKTTGYTNKLHGEGLTPTIEGIEYAFDSFDMNFRKYAHVDWCVKYDPEDLSEVLVINAESQHGKLIKEIDTLEFMLEQKHLQPMALYDRKKGDAEQLQRVASFNKTMENELIDRTVENNEVLRDLYTRNPQLEVLQKMLITDSNGQHKQQKNKQRIQELPAKKEPKYTDYEIIDDVRENY